MEVKINVERIKKVNNLQYLGSVVCKQGDQGEDRKDKNV